MNKVNEQLHTRLSEEVLAVALFQPQSALTPGTSKHQARKQSKRSFAFAVTPTSVHVFGLKDRGYFDTGRVKEEIAVWPRQGMRVATGKGRTNLQTTDFAIPLAMELVSLRMADGFAVTLGITMTLFRDMMRKMVDDFVQALGGTTEPAGA
jgi:hypothetical protein